jgi:UDP-N-acetyl-D-mannosaminuronic acid transferase (WecB/TagA/CpsF family)
MQQPTASIRQRVSADLREIMGLQYWDADLTQVARFLVDNAIAGNPLQVYFVNAHCVNVAARIPAYAQLLRNAPFLFADGAGMALAARLSGVKLTHNVNGTDLFPELCAIAAATGDCCGLRRPDAANTPGSQSGLGSRRLPKERGGRITPA